jgi:glycosyltransferase involved in cell wall biosynthesis
MMGASRRVTLLTHSSERNGGAGSVVFGSADALRAAGHEVTVVAGAGAAGGGVAVVAGAAEPQVGDAVIHELVQVVAATAPDLIHVHDFSSDLVHERLRTVAPVVVDVHNHVTCPSGNRHFATGHECGRQPGPVCLVMMASGRCTHRLDPRPIGFEYRRAMQWRRILQQDAAVVAHSTFVADRVAADADVAVDVVPCFPTTGDEEPEAASGSTVLFVGRIARNKGLDVLLRAAVDAPFEVEVVGDGWWRRRGERLAEQLGIAERVRFVGWLAGDELAAAYRSAAVVAVPSRWPEPFGLVGIEAMAHGRAVVASRGGGIPEWLSDGVTGLLVPSGDHDAMRSALIELLDDDGRRNEMGVAGWRAARERFSERRHVDALERVYERVLATRLDR